MPVTDSPGQEFLDRTVVQFPRWLLLQQHQQLVQSPVGIPFTDRFGVGLFAQFAALAVGDDWYMHVIGDREPQFVLQIDLPGRRIQQIEAAHHFSYALRMIIDDHGKLIGDDPVTAFDDEIAMLPGKVVFHVSLQEVGKNNAIRAGLDAQGMRLTAGILPVATMAGVNIAVSGISCRGLPEGFARANAGIGKVLFLQLLQGGKIGFGLLALKIDPLIPM